jgi:hypothetical protein
MPDDLFLDNQAALVIDDPIELFIFSELEKLREQNKRLRAYVEKSGMWSDLKDIKDWKPYDFLFYFCKLYQEKYRVEYKIGGNIVTAYQKIETFMEVNDLTNEEYRDFVEIAFARHFNESTKPTIGSLCSPTLYKKVMGYGVKDATNKNWFDLQNQIKQESKQFEEKIAEDLSEDVLKVRLAEDNQKFEEALRDTDDS